MGKGTGSYNDAMERLSCHFLSLDKSQSINPRSSKKRIPKFQSQGLGFPNLPTPHQAHRRVATTTQDHLPSPTMTTTLDPHLTSIHHSSTSIQSLPFNTIPTHFITSLLHQSGVDNLIRDPHPHERGLFTVKPVQKENIPLPEEESRVLRTRTERPGISPLLLAKYSAGGNVEADVFLLSARKLLEILYVP